MRNNYLMTAAAILGAGSIYAADVEVKANANSSPKVEAEVRHDNDHREYKQEVRIESSVKPVNRAHNLVGMEVRNQDGDKLGEVKDVVVDLPSGRISYVAVSVGGFLGIREKLIAVAPSDVHPSESGSVLILNASKGEITDAPGFATTNWPDHRSPNFNESPFWHPKGRGNAAVSESGHGKLYTDAKPNDKGARVEANVDRDRKISGNIRSIDRNTIVIDSGAGRSESFSLRDCPVKTSDFRTGDQVTLKYHTDNGRMIIDDLSR